MSLAFGGLPDSVTDSCGLVLCQLLWMLATAQEKTMQDSGSEGRWAAEGPGDLKTNSKGQAMPFEILIQ